MSGTMEIRAMRSGDVDHVVEIAAALKDAPHWPRAVYESALEAGAVPERLCLTACCDGEVCGFVVAATVAGEAEVESIAVAPERQRQGIGARLLESALGELRRRGVTTVHLEVRAANAAAQALYGKQGFVVVGRRAGYYSEPVEDAVLLRRTLGD